MPEPKITVQGTPNPNAAKFTLDRALVEGSASRSYFDAQAAAGDPLARRLFGLEGVVSLLIADNFITVTKAPPVSWDDMIPRVEAAIRESLAEMETD